MNDKEKKRIETFVFEFKNQEVFKEFWDKYFPLRNHAPGIKPLGVAIGNKLEENDELLKLISDLYDIAIKNLPYTKSKEDILIKAEKLLGI